MKRLKSTPEDERILKDEAANPADRASAAESLAFDGFGKQLHPVLDEWLTSSEFILRNHAISMLLGIWGHKKYLNEGLNFLHSDEHWLVRKGSSIALLKFAQEFIEGEKYKNQIMKELLISLIQDENQFVQKSSYKCVYQLITGRKLNVDEDYFDRNRDANWDLLQPYLDKYNLSKPE